MVRCRSALLVIPALAFVLALSGCLGSSTRNSGGGGVKSISLTPAGNTSLEVGATQVFTASALDANNRPVIGADIQFIVSSPPGSTVPPPLSITSTGSACAGTWDSTQLLCSPGNSGIAVVTATANGVTSPAATVYVHNHIASLQLSQAGTQPPIYDCFSQSQTWLYKVTAYDSNGADITATVGQPVWTTTNTGVITTNTNPSLPTPLPLNQVQITAASPGITNLTASISGTSSNFLPVTTCLVSSIRLQVSGTTASSVTVNTGGSVSIQATVLDTLGATISKPPLTWISSNPEIVSFTSANTTSGTNSAAAHSYAGGAVVSAACIPPTCNIGVLPNITVATTTPPYTQQDPSAMPAYVFASDGPDSPIDPLQAYGALSIVVTNGSSTPPTHTAWAATDLCDQSGDSTNGCTSVMFSVSPTTTQGANPIGTIVTVPRTPNSILFNHQSRIYLGSDQGLMYYDAGGSGVSVVSPASTPCNTALCGKVIAVSDDGKQAVISDATNPSVPQVYIYNTSNSTSPVTGLVLPAVATAASFSPDESKLFILTDAGVMYVYSTVEALAPVALPSSASSGTDVEFAADGSFAYVAGSSGNTGSISAYSTCATTSAPSVDLLGPGGSVATTGIPLQIFPSPVLVHDDTTDPGFISQDVYIFEPPFVQVLTAIFEQNVPKPPVQPTPYFCNVPDLTSFSVTANYTLQGGEPTPVYANLVNNGSELIVVARFTPSVQIFSNGTSSTIPLDGSYDPRWASAADDGSVVFVAACDQYPNNDTTQPCAAGSVHIVTTAGSGRDQKVPYTNNVTTNMCSGQGAGAPICFPDLIAIKP